MYKKILLTSILFLISLSCSDNQDNSQTIENELSKPGWPVIFQGFARVDGNDVPAGVPIYAKLGDHRS